MAIVSPKPIHTAKNEGIIRRVVLFRDMLPFYHAASGYKAEPVIDLEREFVLPLDGPNNRSTLLGTFHGDGDAGT